MIEGRRSVDIAGCDSKRFAIITPYYKEDRGVLQRCIQSVKDQSVSADHFLVSDGFPQDWLDEAHVRHLRLGCAHGDAGNTPRGLGTLLAVSEGYDGIGLLDADNWYDKNHVEECCNAAYSTAETPADIVFAKRRVFLPDGQLVDVPEEDIDHVDTSCFWFLPGSFHLLHYWTIMPHFLGPACDCIFYRMIGEQLLTIRSTEKITVNFTSTYIFHYLALGITPPREAKFIDLSTAYEQINQLDLRQQELIKRRCGFDIFDVAKQPYNNKMAAAAIARLNQGAALHQQGRLAEGERIYREVLQQQSNNFYALRLLGVIALETRHTERAVELIGKAIRLNANFAIAHDSLGTALLDLKRPEDALASYDRAIALKPDFAEAHLNRGVVLQDLKRPEDALASYNRAIALKPDLAEAHFNRGNVLQDLKRPEDALASYDRAIALKPDLAMAYNNRGNVLLSLKRPEDALASFDKAIALQPGFAQAHDNRRLAPLGLKRPEDALADFDKAIALQPGFVVPNASGKL